MEVQKYDRENSSVVVSLSVDELEVIAAAFRLAKCHVDEGIAPVSERESTLEDFMEFTYCEGIIRDVLKRLPGEIDALIEFYRNLED